MLEINMNNLHYKLHFTKNNIRKVINEKIKNVYQTNDITKLY